MTRLSKLGEISDNFFPEYYCKVSKFCLIWNKWVSQYDIQTTKYHL